MTGDVKLTEAQRWCLARADEGFRVFSFGGYAIHTSLKTGERRYGIPAAAYRACVRRGWVENGRITPAGRHALGKEGDR